MKSKDEPKILGEPREYDFTKSGEIDRWFREMKSYLTLHGQHFLDGGTDWKGRKFAFDAFFKIKEAIRNEALSLTQKNAENILIFDEGITLTPKVRVPIITTQKEINKIISKEKQKANLALLGKIYKIIQDSRETIQSLWDYMEEQSKSVIIGKRKLTEGEEGNIEIEDYECLTEHDRQHVSQICERKRFIYDLEKLVFKEQEIDEV